MKPAQIMARECPLRALKYFDARSIVLQRLNQLRIRDKIHHGRAVVIQRFIDGGVHLVLFGDTNAERAAVLSIFGKIRIFQSCLPDRKMIRLLLLGDFSQHGIVEQKVFDRHLVLDRRGQLAHEPGKAAVTGDGEKMS